MKKIALLTATMIAIASPAIAGPATREVRVLASAATEIAGSLGTRRAVEIQNLGPNAIFCAIGLASGAVVNKSRKIASGGAWAIDLPSNVKLYCIAASADQVSGAATIVTEAP